MKTLIKQLLIFILLSLIYANTKCLHIKALHESNIINFTEYNAKIFTEPDRLSLGWNGITHIITNTVSHSPYNESYLSGNINDVYLSQLINGYYRQIDKYKADNVEKSYTVLKFKYKQPISFAKTTDLIDNICDNFIDEKLKYKVFFQKKYNKQANGIDYCYYNWDLKNDYRSKEDFININKKKHCFVLFISMDRECIVWLSQ